MLPKRILNCVLLSVFTALNAQASVLVNPPEPYPQKVMGDALGTIYFGGSAGGVPSGGAFYNGTQGYFFIDTTTGIVWLDVSTDHQLGAGQTTVVSIAPSASTSTLIPLTGAGYVSGNGAPPTCASSPGACNTDGTNYAYANYTGGVLRISFSIAALCSVTGSTATSLCNGTSGPSGTFSATTQTINLKVSFATATNVNGQSTNVAEVASATFNLGITDVPPSISCPSSTAPEDYYFPGDQQVFITPAHYSVSAQTSGSDLRYLLLLANRSTVMGFSDNAVPVNEVIGYIPSSAGRTAVDGFVNSEDGLDNAYNFAIYAQNVAGIVSPTVCSPSPTVQLFAQQISGVLTESKCFIATAAYQDGRAAPVMMLRRFRDQILTESKLGRGFIEHYYKYSPALAEWAWDKPIIRSFALKLLVPIELMAWAILKFSEAQESQSTQPYLDRIKKKVTEDAPAPSESYIEQERRKLEAIEDAGGSYTEQLKRELGEPTDATGYSEQLRTTVGSDNRDSQIQAVLEGRDKYPRPERPPIKNAISFKLGVNPGLSVTNPVSTATFDQVYGTGFRPDLFLHYERQLFHSENFGSFGLGVDGGVSYAEGFGLLRRAFAGSLISATKMNFFQVPVLINATYRFNLLRILRPYVSAGAGVLGYLEVRHDERPDHRGYSFIYSGTAGVSLLLDFLDPKSSRDGFLSAGLQRTYLFVEYFRLKSLETAGVSFARDGIYSGFLFEY